VDAHRRFGLDIAVDGAGSHWQGDHIDWDCFFAAFVPPDDSAESSGQPTSGGSSEGCATTCRAPAPTSSSRVP
jgi:hypothetical protein